MDDDTRARVFTEADQCMAAAVDDEVSVAERMFDAIADYERRPG